MNHRRPTRPGSHFGDMGGHGTFPGLMGVLHKHHRAELSQVFLSAMGPASYRTAPLKQRKWQVLCST